jgi:hypothetical protein
MRKVLLMLAVSGAALAAPAGARAMPAALPTAVAVASPAVQEVQFYRGEERREHWRGRHWRHRHWRREGWRDRR